MYVKLLVDSLDNLCTKFFDVKLSLQLVDISIKVGDPSIGQLCPSIVSSTTTKLGRRSHVTKILRTGARATQPPSNAVATWLAYKTNRLARTSTDG